ncbi:MAG: guanylate kinase [Candidatus Saccharibacteria bacterium]|nr:guanylate kinase [Candidatus Saccharibacteria bacterium]
MNQALSDKLSSYKPSQSAIDLIKKTPILLLVGPTGAGKDALKDRLLQTNQYHHLVSHTTRPPRINHGVLEQDGLEYHFMDLKKAERMLDEHGFVEAKMYSGNIYGTSVAEIQVAHDESKVALTDIEVQGVKEFKAFDEAVMAIFLLPPDFATWQARLQRRYGDVVDAADSRLRLQTALDELEQLLNTDHYLPIINDDINAALDEVQAYVTTRQVDPDLEAKAHATAQMLADDIRNYLETH